ncbi:hypothetical protein [Kitasatospora sp. NBC_01302]|uniref:hypothetical protein n=1 Tax=Kitasatospora sp. NBC_01302 TaxID=2903575 RepID=UPI002E1364B7|nr:hypothetical protein OG294_40000 [Kitasatospora sp. NBC_01302]
MLTITITSKLDQLRHRAAQADTAETALTDTNRRLEQLLEQRREASQELLDMRNDRTAVQDKLEAAQKLADEAKASEARLRRSEQLMRQGVDSLLATRDRTIAELRADLERARNTRSAAESELPEHTVLQFRTVGGGLAVVTGEPTTYYSDRYCEPLDEPVDGHRYAWQCLTCGDDSGGYTTWDRDDMRRRANEHAAGCRAIPAGTGDTTTKKEKGTR